MHVLLLALYSTTFAENVTVTLILLSTFVDTVSLKILNVGCVIIHHLKKLTNHFQPIISYQENYPIYTKPYDRDVKTYKNNLTTPCF